MLSITDLNTPYSALSKLGIETVFTQVEAKTASSLEIVILIFCMPRGGIAPIPVANFKKSFRPIIIMRIRYAESILELINCSTYSL